MRLYIITDTLLSETEYKDMVIRAYPICVHRNGWTGAMFNGFVHFVKVKEL